MDRYGHVATADAVFIELRKNHDCCQKVTWVRWLQYYLLLLVIRVLSVLSVFCVSSSFLLFYIFFLFIACCHCSCCSVPHVLPPLVLHHTFSPPPLYSVHESPRGSPSSPLIWQLHHQDPSLVTSPLFPHHLKPSQP